MIESFLNERDGRLMVIEKKDVSSDKCNILDVGVNAVNIPLVLTCIEHAIFEHTKGYICATPVHSIMVAQDDHNYKSVLNNAFLCVPDGMPLVWLGKLAGHKSIGRVYGPDLMRAVFDKSRDGSWTHYLYGSDPATLGTLKSCLSETYPEVSIVGQHAPPFRPLSDDEFASLQADVTRCQPDIFWVGLGAPKQDIFMAETLALLDTTVMVGVGAAFDFLAGTMKEAPVWMQRSGLQWAYRLYREPGRLWRRYLINNPRFVFMLLRQKLGL